jgi:hypothetical protein
MIRTFWEGTGLDDKEWCLWMKRREEISLAFPDMRFL